MPVATASHGPSLSQWPAHGRAAICIPRLPATYHADALPQHAGHTCVQPPPPPSEHMQKSFCKEDSYAIPKNQLHHKVRICTLSNLRNVAGATARKPSPHKHPPSPPLPILPSHRITPTHTTPSPSHQTSRRHITPPAPRPRRHAEPRDLHRSRRRARPRTTPGHGHRPAPPLTAGAPGKRGCQAA